MPIIDFQDVLCRHCYRCIRSCETKAIRFSGGHAYIMPELCILCGQCSLVCPTGAITMVPLHPDDDLSPMIPSVNEALCIGCGACEHLCPVRPVSAIQVEGHEVHKHI